MILDFLQRSSFFLDFLARLIAKFFSRNEKTKILARNLRLSEIIEDYPRSWQENQDAKHWENAVCKQPTTTTCPKIDNPHESQ